MRERKTFVRKTASFEQTTQRYDKRSRDVSSVVLLQSLTRGLEKPFGPHEIGKREAS
jgi:hypothetical protein